MGYMTNVSNQDIDLEIRKIFLLFKRRWKLGLIILIASIALAAISATSKKSEYVAVGRLLFKNSSTSKLTGIEPSASEYEPLEKDANPVITEIEVLKSTPILAKTIDSLKLTNDEGEAVKPADLLAKLTIKPIAGTDVVEVSYQSNSPDRALKVTNQLMENYITNSRLIGSENVTVANKIIGNQLPKAKADIAEKEKAIQQFQEKYQIFFVEDESQIAVENLRDLEREIKNVENQIQEVEAHSSALQQQVGMNSQQAIAWSKLSQSPMLREELGNLREVKSQLAAEQERFADDHPTVLALRDRVANLETSLQKQITQKLGSSSEFAIANLQISERENVPQRITSSLAQAEVQKRGLIRKLDNLRSTYRTYQQNIARIPQLAHKYRNLQLELETSQSKYKFLLDKSQELELAGQQSFDNVRVIESAQMPEDSINPSYSILIIVGSFVGIVLAISAMAGIDLVDNLVKSTEEISNIFRYKILGIIPDFTRASKLMSEREISFRPENEANSILVNRPKFLNSQKSISNNLALTPRVGMLPVREVPTSLGSKAFWMLQAKLKLLSQNRAEKTIVVSSSLPQEGKSIVTANLALTLSELGEKVLIIDGNLYQPIQKELWQVDSYGGVGDVILNRKELSSVIIPISDNLDLLPANASLCNPLKIVDSIKMKQLLWSLSEKYQLILIDSPSLEEAPDALSLAKIADGMLLVAKIGVLDYQRATKSKEILENTGINVIGMAINNA